MDSKDADYIDDNFIEQFMASLDIQELKEQFKVKPEKFQTRLDLQCYLIALKISATDEDFFISIPGKPKIGKSTDGIWIGVKTIEALRKEFSIDIPEFDVERDIHYPPITENEVIGVIKNAKPPVMMFDRVIFGDDTLEYMGVKTSELDQYREGTCVYFSNMKTRKKDYNAFENKVKDTLQNSFIYDLIFGNPRMPEKDNEEFCDVLIVFFDSILIIQCKESFITDEEGLTKATIVRGLNQLKTSWNRAKNKSVKLFMINSNKVFKDYRFSDIKNIYPILVVNRKISYLDYNKIGDMPEIKKLDFVPIILSIDDLKFLVAELDTPSDLFTYFKRREEFLTKNTMPIENEVELLSYYLLNNKNFESKYVGNRLGIISGFYEEYKNGQLTELFIKKKELDKVSYWVDDILRNAHLSYETNYLKAIEEALKLNRVQRRKLAQRAEEKRNKSIAEKKDAWGLTIYEEKPEIAFVVYFAQEFDDQTQPFFYSMCACAQYKTNVKKVVGLAQTLSNPGYNIGLYFEKGEGFTPEEETALKKLCDGFWGEGTNSKYGEFSE
jgi:hypothetical protein